MSPCVALPSLREAGGGGTTVLTTVAALYAAGVDLDWGRLVAATGRCVRLPTYPWQRQRFWAPTRKWLAASSSAASESAAATVETPAAPNLSGVPEAGSDSLPAATIHVRPDLTTPYVAPRTELEQNLAQSWSAILEIDRIGIHDNFFELGGHSLLATQAVSQIAHQLQIELPLRELFETPTIAGLAGRIEAALQGGGATSQGPIVRIPRDGDLPLSLNQEALWFLDRLEPDRPTYMLHLALNVRGPLNIPALERALLEIARRHEVLRTTFPEVNGSPVQVIAPIAHAAGD